MAKIRYPGTDNKLQLIHRRILDKNVYHSLSCLLYQNRAYCIKIIAGVEVNG